MKQCTLCEKGSIVRRRRNLLRGHHNPTPATRRYPNLQLAKVDGKRIKICTQCLRTLAKKAK